ncbi:MAG: Txe/YoeB family addiction module toxin [Bacteroidales bacterium]|nr:Txe/YoeB family addiction module toxin [Bacteroidales bacterium]
MEIALTKEAKKDLIFWEKSGNVNIQKKITKLFEDIIKTPYTGIGNPEQLKYELYGFWSRRINKEHRLIYKISKDEKFIKVYSLKGHYL